MQTPSHLIINAAIGTKLQQSRIPFSWKPFLLGSILPDIPFAVLTVAGEILYRWFIPLPVTNMSMMEYLHFDLFFSSWWWIIPHNFFHSVIITGLFLLTGWWLWNNNRPWGSFLFWLALSALIHTVIDIFTHTSDGPLFLFPLNLTYRFQSPVSYWEAESFGRYFIVFEYGLDLILLVFLWLGWRSKDVNPTPQN